MTSSAIPKAPIAAPRSLHEVREAARRVNCGECWQVPGEPCVPDPDGDHVARFGRAMRRGLLTGPELIAVLETLDAFTSSTVVVCDEQPGGVIPLLPGGIDPLADPDPSWLATASPEDIKAEVAIRGHLVKLHDRLGLIPRNPAELAMAEAILEAATAATAEACPDDVVAAHEAEAQLEAGI